MKTLDFVKNNIQYIMIVIIAIGLSNVYFFGGFDTPKNILIAIVVLLVIYPVMINTKFEEVVSHIKEPRPIFCSFFINFMISPLIAFGIGILFLSDQPVIFAALMLLALIPTSSMSAAWTAFSNARMSTALYLIPANLIFAAFIALPFIYPLFLGDAIEINRLTIIKNILLVFLLPLILGEFTRRIILRYKTPEYFKNKIKPNLTGISSVGILILLFFVMSLKRNTLLLENYSLIFTILIPVVLYYIFMYTISIIWAKFSIKRKILSPDKAVVLIYTSTARHINISLALVISAFAIEQASVMILLLIIAYIVQLPSLAFYAQHWGEKMIEKMEVKQ